jgi:ATPase subunit of ABC transporter with duplicated ATPase domains
MHNPIILNNLSLSFPHKVCFEGFSTLISFQSRIGIIGRNGSGKSSLLSIILKMNLDRVGYVPQTIEGFDSLSGGERFQKKLTQALSLCPSLLLLDEPTNHLDKAHRESLMRMLHHYDGTLIAVSHDIEFLQSCTDILWHIRDGKVHILSGKYNDYLEEGRSQRKKIERELEIVHRQKKEMHHKLMKEQQRASKSKVRGSKSIENRKWPTVVSHAKASRSQETSGRKKSLMDHKKTELSEKLESLHLPESIVPKFDLSHQILRDEILLLVIEGGVGYDKDSLLLSNINFQISSFDKVAFIGKNGSGKSTLIKAILGEQILYKKGEWHGVKKEDIGYLDQHYKTLKEDRSALETIQEIKPYWTHQEIRSHLNNFLFRKNEEVYACVKTLSEGEKARLSLACIAARPPKLLILDEITNNLDLETKEHVAMLLANYPYALIIVCHEENFLKRIGITDYYLLENLKASP